MVMVAYQFCYTETDCTRCSFCFGASIEHNWVRFQKHVNTYFHRPVEKSQFIASYINGLGIFTNGPQPLTGFRWFPPWYKFFILS